MLFSRTGFWLWPVLLAFVVCGVGCRKNEQLAQLPDDPTANGTRTVRTVPVTVDERGDGIQATGTTLARSTTKIMPLVPGLIVKMPVREGEVVQKGQVLAVLDSRNYKLQLRQAQAAVQAARVANDATTREKQRFERLLKEDATARAQYDRVLDRFHGAEAQMKQALVAVDMAKEALSDTTLRSPYRGVVVKKMASLGDYATSMPPTVLLVLMEICTLELHVSLPEPELPSVAVGTEVRAEFPSIGRTVTAKVARVGRTIDPMTRSFTAIVEIDNQDMSLEAGLFARVSIRTTKPRRRLLVPEQSVVDEGNGVYSVFVVRKGRARRRVIRITGGDQDTIEVTNGLVGGESIILDSAGLMDGDPVTPQHNGDKPATKSASAAPVAP